MLNLPSSTFYDNWSALLLSSFGRYKLIDYINHRTPKDSLFLVFRQNDFAFYGKRRFIRHLDPRMIPIYQIQDKYQAAQALREMGIDYIFLPSYMTPTYTDTCIHKVVADPLLCSLAVEANGAKLYRLLPLDSMDMVSSKRKHVVFKGGDIRWTAFWGNDDFYVVEPAPNGYGGFQITPHQRLTFIFTGTSDVWKYSLGIGESIHLEPGTYQIQAEADGEGWVTLFLLDHRDTNRGELRKLWESSMTGTTRHMANQFFIPEDSKQVKLIFAVSSVKPFTLKDILIQRVDTAPVHTTTTPPLLSWNSLDEAVKAGSEKDGTACFQGQRMANQLIYSGDGNWVLPPSFYAGTFHPGHLSPFQKAFKVSFNVAGYWKGQLFCMAYAGTFPHNMFIDQISIQTDRPKKLEYILIVPKKFQEFRLGLTVSKMPPLKSFILSFYKFLGGHISLNKIQMEKGPWELTLGEVHIEEISGWKEDPEIQQCLEKYASYYNQWERHIAACRSDTPDTLLKQ